MAAKAAQPGGDRPFDGILRREVDVEFRSINEEERSFEVVASTETLDSHGDVMKQFWDLSRFEKNGVVLWNHNLALYMGNSAEETLPIGRAENVRVEAKKLLAKIYLLKGDAKEEPLVDKIWRRVKQRVQKGVSVGFKPGQVVRIVKADGTTDYYELGSKERPNELREISLVPMGSNPDAVAKSIAFEREHLSRIAAKSAAPRGKQEKKTMDDDLKEALEQAAQAKAALTQANTAKALADARISQLEERNKSLEASLASEKTASTKLEKDLDAARVELKTVKDGNAKITLDALQGVKFMPAEREELDKLVADIGIDRVKSLVEKRPDVGLTQPATAAGAELGDKSKAAPPPVDTSATPDAASDDFLKSATDGATKAVA
jgi:hypothetical protein